jgi:hypothetical protein
VLACHRSRCDGHLLVNGSAGDTTLTLACQGTTTAGTEDKPEPVSMGIIVNFTKKTVHGFVDPILRESHRSR